MSSDSQTFSAVFIPCDYQKPVEQLQLPADTTWIARINEILGGDAVPFQNNKKHKGVFYTLPPPDEPAGCTNARASAVQLKRIVGDAVFTLVAKATDQGGEVFEDARLEQFVDGFLAGASERRDALRYLLLCLKRRPGTVIEEPTAFPEYSTDTWPGTKQPWTLLQEYCQAQGWPVPVSRDEPGGGKDHIVSAVLPSLRYKAFVPATGSRSKMLSKHQAALLALRHLQALHDEARAGKNPYGVFPELNIGSEPITAPLPLPAEGTEPEPDELTVPLETEIGRFSFERMFEDMDFIDPEGAPKPEAFWLAESSEHPLQQVTTDGLVGKKVVRSGNGRFPTETSKVFVQFVAYRPPKEGEFVWEPFYSSRAVDNPLYFRVESGVPIPFFAYAVRSMTLGEKAFFLCDARYGAGEIKNFCTPIDCSSLMYYLELLEINEPGSKYSLQDALLRAEQERETGNGFFQTCCYRKAIHAYNSVCQFLHSLWLVDVITLVVLTSANRVLT
eukprot:TRINITY_DN5238_c0_g1_i3.p1 TRINITY_DN5238_c0_g1~~TRINITY_DN5238_c0_g1_i3.p1  ORF type:complete len:502 (-),score=78.27 TRINITY_DN5238_c0_g1_i3:476-1981(-)